MSVHFIIRFRPLQGTEVAFRKELLRVVEASRAETGCLRIYAFESIREPLEFAIHSEWKDEASLEFHATLAEKFLAAVSPLLQHQIEGIRLHPIGGGDGSGCV